MKDKNTRVSKHHALEVYRKRECRTTPVWHQLGVSGKLDNLTLYQSLPSGYKAMWAVELV
jgi:hypothetical protein